MTLFGPAGNSDSFTRQFKASVSAPAWLRERGLGCYEYQCGRGVHLGEDTARAIGSAAADNGIRMSLHAPYFINLSGGAPERVEKNLDYILQAARACGFMTKDETRALAREAGFARAVSAPESQDICFVPDGDYCGFIEREDGPLTPGRFVLEDGRDLGPHRGFERYTVGQRRGLGVAWEHPLYVLRKDAAAHAAG